MRLCSYIVRYDRGLAPNPFWGFCTVAICTPNHMGIQLESGDWILGTTTSARGNKLLYVMQVFEKLNFNSYYKDPRFQNKIPVIRGNWQQRVGDNMYYQGADGDWKQHQTLHHRRQEVVKQDLKYPFVFIGTKYFYFGKHAIDIPAECKPLIWNRQGCKTSHEIKVAENFVDWLQDNHQPGIYGNPIDNKEADE